MGLRSRSLVCLGAPVPDRVHHVVERVLAVDSRLDNTLTASADEQRPVVGVCVAFVSVAAEDDIGVGGGRDPFVDHATV